MEKAIEIKRRAQRCIQNGDLDGALNEYEKLVDSEESDPYNYVLLADLLFKKGDQSAASERYLSAVAAYEKASLYKNAIAVCKKMLRLTLTPAKVLQSLGHLHALDGLAGEAALYYVQYAEHMVRSSAPAEAAHALRQAFDVCQDNIRVLEQLSEAYLLAGDEKAAAAALVEAAGHYRSRGAESDARRVSERASSLDGQPSAAEASAIAEIEAPLAPAHPDSAGAPESFVTPTRSFMPEPGARSLERIETVAHSTEKLVAKTEAGKLRKLQGFETGRHESAPAPEPEAAAPIPMGEPDAPAEEVVRTIDENSGPESLAAAWAALEAAAPAGPPLLDMPKAAPAVEPEPPLEDEQGTDAVYEIPTEDSGPADEPLAEPAVAGDVYVISEENTVEDEPALSPAAPGLAFAAEPDAPPAPSPEHVALGRVETLLAQAQEHFRAGDRDGAAEALAQAAQAYEALGRLDNAATIYRSLGHGAQAAPATLELWLANCERRGDAREAAQVACELGDRAMNDGNEPIARAWFERAYALDATNETAVRRLQRLGGVAAPVIELPLTASAVTAAPVAGAPGEMGRVEVAVGRAEAVSFDLAGLLAEFQRGVEVQLAGDAQSHYDLGMTYREMGLLDQAVESFRFAQADPRLAARAHEMVGRCLAEQGRHNEAAGEYRRALGLPGIGPENDAELRYHLGGALSESGEAAAALEEYERVEQQLPGFEDVEARITALRRVLGLA